MARGRPAPRGPLEDRIAAGEPVPALTVAAGAESLLRDRFVDLVSARLLGSADSPDLVVLHGPLKAGDAEGPHLAEVVEEVRTRSMFAAGGTKVVVLRRADALLGAEADALKPLLDDGDPAGHLVLVVETSPADRRAPAGLRRALDALASAGLVVSCDAPSAEPPRSGGASPLARWLSARAREKGKDLAAGDADLLVHRSGANLAVLDGALDAAILHAGDAPRISARDLEAVAPRGPAEALDRFVELALAREGVEALRVLTGLYREGAFAFGAKTPTRGETAVTHLVLNAWRRTAREARGALATRAREGSRAPLPPSLRYGCRAPMLILQRNDTTALARLLADLARLETDLKSGLAGGERTRMETLVALHAVEA